MDIPDLPSRVEGDDVWCERCQRVHNRVTFSKEDWARIMTESAQKLSDSIDEAALRYALKPVGR